ncbi:hypothetical protein D3C85_1830420 [compost metagenome]
MLESAGSFKFRFAADLLIAPKKHADQPAASSCSGLVPSPFAPGEVSLMSKRPSELFEKPSRPPVVIVDPL